MHPASSSSPSANNQNRHFHQQQDHFLQQPKTRNEFVKSLSDFFKRDLISIPLIKSYAHQQISQRCGLKAATLELDTSAFPNIEYIAGNRLSVYPVNPSDHVQTIMKHIIDDISPKSVHIGQTKTPPSSPRNNATTSNSSKHFLGVNRETALGLPTATGTSIKSDNPLSHFISTMGTFIGRKDGPNTCLRIVLTYLYDITTPPSRDLLRIMADCCSNKEHKDRLILICKSDENWERWICQNLRTLKSTMEEFNSCLISAKRLLSELAPQQPRQYSISSIKSNQRFRTEIIVIQHKFDRKQINISLQNLKEREIIHQQDAIQLNHIAANDSNQQKNLVTTSAKSIKATDNTTSGVQQNLTSIRSLRSMGQFNVASTSPISSQQINKVPSFSGPVASMYAMSNVGSTSGPQANNAGALKSTSTISNKSRTNKSSISVNNGQQKPNVHLNEMIHSSSHSSSLSKSKQFDGLCSNYLLSLQLNDLIICEFVENPRFTLKGNRERPIMMIGQDVGCIAFRPFWQQRALEHDRAQVFYTLFKDLKAKKFGDMQLVCLTGNKSRIEDLFKREISSILTHKIISSASYIDRRHLIALLDQAAATSGGGGVGGGFGSNASNSQIGLNNNNHNQQQGKQIFNINTGNFSLLINQDKELLELGQKIVKLLIEQNGCLYTCCDPQMTQAIEILLVESITNYKPTTKSLSRDRVMMALLPKWKGRKLNNERANIIDDKYSFKLENPFERAQIVQEIYDQSI